MKTISIDQAQKQLSELSRRLSDHGGTDVYWITDHGKPTLVMMSFERYREIEETLECLGDKRLLDGIEQSRKDIDSGRVLNEEDADAAIGW